MMYARATTTRDARRRRAGARSFASSPASMDAVEALEHRLRQAETRVESERRLVDETLEKMARATERCDAARDARDAALRRRALVEREYAEARQTLEEMEARQRAAAAAAARAEREAREQERRDDASREIRLRQMREAIENEENMRAVMIERTREAELDAEIADLSSNLPGGPWRSLKDIPSEFLDVCEQIVRTRRECEEMRSEILHRDS